MAMKVGELYSLLRLDDASFNSSMLRAEGRTASFRQKIKDLVVSSTGIGTGLATAFAAFEIKGVVNSTSQYGEELHKLRRETGLTSEDSARLLFTLRHVGLDTSEASRAFGIFAKNLKGVQDEETGVTTGGKRVADILKDAGINAFDSAGNIKPLTEILPQLADLFARMPDGLEKTGLAMQLFGRGGRQLIPFLNLGSAEMAKLSKEADRLGLTLSAGNIEKIRQYTFAQRDFSEAIQGLKVQGGLTLLPLIQALNEGFTNGQPRIRGFFKALGEGMDSAPVHEFTTSVSTLFHLLLETGQGAAVFGTVILGGVLIPHLIAAAETTALLTTQTIELAGAVGTLNAVSVLLSGTFFALPPAALLVGIAALAAGTFLLTRHFMSGSTGAQTLKDRLTELNEVAERTTRAFERQGIALPQAQVLGLAEAYTENKQSLYENLLALGQLRTVQDGAATSTLSVRDAFKLHGVQVLETRDRIKVLTSAQDDLKKKFAEAAQGMSEADIAGLLGKVGLTAADVHDVMPVVADDIAAAGDTTAEQVQNLRSGADALKAIYDSATAGAGGLDDLRHSFENLAAPETQEEARLRGMISLIEAQVANRKASIMAAGGTAKDVTKANVNDQATIDALQAQLDAIQATKTATVDLAVAQDAQLGPSMESLTSRVNSYQASLQDTTTWNRVVANSLIVLQDAAKTARDQGLGSLADDLEKKDIPALQNLMRATNNAATNTNFKNVGTNITNGIASGINAGHATVVESVNSLTRDLIKLLHPMNWTFDSNIVQTYAKAGFKAGEALVGSLGDALSDQIGAVTGILRKPLSALRDMVSGVQSEMSRLSGLTTVESAAGDAVLAHLRLQRAQLGADISQQIPGMGAPVLGPAGIEMEKQKKALDDKIAAEENLLSIQKLQRDVIAAQGEAADKTLPTNQEVLDTMRGQVDVISKVTSFVDEQSSSLQLKFIPSWESASEKLAEAADKAGEVGANLGDVNALLQDIQANKDAELDRIAKEGLKHTIDLVTKLKDAQNDLDILGAQKVAFQFDPASLKTLKEVEERAKHINDTFDVIGNAKIAPTFTIDGSSATDPLGLGAVGRAAGGDAPSGMPLIVGERRAELFVPKTAGRIMPNVGGFSGPMSQETLAVLRSIEESLRSGRNIDQRFYGTTVNAKTSARDELATLGFHSARMGD